MVMPLHTLGVAACWKEGMAYRKTFKASVLEHLSACVGAGRAGQGGCPLSQFQTKAASFPTPTSAPLGDTRLSERPVAAPSPAGTEYQFVSLS